MPFTRSEDIINSLKQRLGLDDKMYAVMQAWEREAGAYAPYAVLAGIKKGTLVVDVTTSVHFQELTLRKRELMHKINQYLGSEKVVKNIKFQLKK
jgi:uncharacterized protein YdcH (DUF465 family)